MPDQKVFPPDVLREIHTRSQGIPRVINALCDNLLLTAFALESRQTTVEMLDEVCLDMRLEWPGMPRHLRSHLHAEGQQPPVLSPEV